MISVMKNISELAVFCSASKKKMLRPPTNVFTNIMLSSSALGFLWGTQSHLWTISTCWIVGVASTFAILDLIDPTAYRRKARKHDWPMWLFHAGNVVLHYIPLYFALAYPPIKCQTSHGVVAAALHLAWPLTTPDHGLFLDSTYIPLRKQQWYFLWTITVVTQISWATCMQLVFENAI